jgi:hypothetical protein
MALALGVLGEQKASVMALGSRSLWGYLGNYRLAAPLRRDENSLLNSFRRKLSPTMQRHTISRQNESLDNLVEFCRRVDEDLKMQQQSRRNTAYALFSYTPTRTVTPSPRLYRPPRPLSKRLLPQRPTGPRLTRTPSPVHRRHEPTRPPPNASNSRLKNI